MLGLRRSEERAIQATTWGTWPGDDATPVWSGATVNKDTSIQLLAVYGSVRLIVDSIATLPLDVYRKRPNGTREEMPIPSWLVTPTVGMSRIAWLSQVLSSLLLDGNAFIAVKRSPTGIVELVALDAAAVTITREGGSPVLRVNGVEPNYQVVHIPALLLAGRDVGLSPVEAARQSIGLGLATIEHGARLFGQGTVMSGVIETPHELPPEKAKEIAKAWTRHHGGNRKAHLPGVLEGGATWKPTGITNEQAQFLQTRGHTAGEIAGQMFLVDPSDLGIPVTGTSLTYANLGERNLRRVQVTLLPWIVRLEEALSTLLPPDIYTKFNVDGLLRGDLKTRYDSYKVGIDTGFLVPAEARDLEELPVMEIDTPPSFSEQVEAVGALIRAGFDPSAALAACGLPPIKHTGLTPITVTENEPSPTGAPNA